MISKDILCMKRDKYGEGEGGRKEWHRRKEEINKNKMSNNYSSQIFNKITIFFFCLLVLIKKANIKIIVKTRIMVGAGALSIQKLEYIPINIAINDTPITIAPMKTYCLLLPHFDFVLSEINPIIGSVIASKKRGKKKISPHNKGGKPKSCTRTTMKIPRAAGNI